MYSRNKSTPNFQNLSAPTEQQQSLLVEESEFETSNMSSSSTVLDLGGLTSNWQNHSSLTYRMGNSKIRFQKPFMLALLFFCGILILLYFTFFGISLRSNSKYSNPYGDSFLANYGKIESSTFAFQSREKRLLSYNTTYPLTAPGSVHIKVFIIVKVEQLASILTIRA